VCQPATSTYAWPLIGSSTQALYLGGSTAAVVAGNDIYYPINNYVFGLAVPTISGGMVQVVKGTPPKGASITSTQSA
jgi:predicted Zn-dependent protease